MWHGDPANRQVLPFLQPGLYHGKLTKKHISKGSAFFSPGASPKPPPEDDAGS